MYSKANMDSMRVQFSILLAYFKEVVQNGRQYAQKGLCSSPQIAMHIEMVDD